MKIRFKTPKLLKVLNIIADQFLADYEEMLLDKHNWRVGVKVIAKNDLENSGIKRGDICTISYYDGEYIEVKEQQHIVKWIPQGYIHKSHFNLVSEL